MAVFEYLRLSLAKPKQSSLLGSDGQPFREITRREYLDRIFERDRWDFEYYGSNYSLIRDGVYDNIFAGRIGKQVIEPIHKGPEQKYAIEMVEDWKPAWFLMDLASDSQLIAMQSGIASPKRLIRALLDRIESSTPSHEYESFLEYISDAAEFWSAVKEFKGKITRVDFTFVPPNALGLHEKIKEIVKAAQNVGAEKTKFSHTNAHGGLDPQGEYIEAALETTSEGAGSVIVKAGRKTVFSSEKNRKTIDIPNEEVPAAKDDAAVRSLIKRVHGEEK